MTDMKCFSIFGFSFGVFGTTVIMFLWAFTSSYGMFSKSIFYIFVAFIATYNGVIDAFLHIFTYENNTNYGIRICNREHTDTIAVLFVFLSIIIPPIYFDILFPNVLNSKSIIIWVIIYVLTNLFIIKIASHNRKYIKELENKKNRFYLYIKRLYFRIFNDSTNKEVSETK